MNFSFLTSFFQTDKTVLQTPDSVLLKKIKKIAQEHDLYLFHNKTIYHHNLKKTIPLVIFHPYKGIFLFEHKDWSYDDLKNATIEKATNERSSKDNLAFESVHEFIIQKYKELTHTDELAISNFLLMENLDTPQYEHLHDSFKELLPKHRVIFNDSTQEEIVAKFALEEHALHPLLDLEKIIGNLFIQYALFDTRGKLSVCTQEQREFIDASIKGHQTLSAKTGCGKTNVLLLKALVEKLENPKKQITIIEPTRIACDILKQKLLALIEHAIVEVNPVSIQIITPLELVNKHLQALDKPLLNEQVIIDPKLLSRTKKIADFVICDDSELLCDPFLQYVRLMQKKETLLLVTNQDIPTPDYELKHNFVSLEKKVAFKHANEHAKALQILRELLQTHKAKDILVISNPLSKDNLYEDLEGFIEDKAILLDSSKSLLDQELDSLLLATYEQISGLHAKFVIMLDVCEAHKGQIEYAQNLATETLYVVYEESCQAIKTLKEKYETQNERS
ncbi:MAG: DEAD/DEAH box helicase family protein [Thiovulaceae bacterium]|nr:DEAD/DEAH box helicase family protein [Sulfurimonadaceae bacterium]